MRGKIIGIAIGIGVMIWGLVLINTVDVDCGGRTLSEGDVCDVTTIRGGDVSTSHFTAESQRTFDHRIGPYVLALGALIVVLSCYFLYRTILRRRPNTYARRQQLAATNGWQYEGNNSTVVRGTEYETAKQVAGVLRGTMNGVPFTILDIVNKYGRPQTLWFAFVPPSAPEGLNAWMAHSKHKLRKTPGHFFDVSPRMLIESDTVLHELNDKELVRPIERLALIINLYLTDLNAPANP